MALASRSRIVGSIAVLTAAAGLIGRAQPPASQLPTFKSGVEYVDVDVVVTDGEGHFVRGLTRDDFEVLEDGRRQEITAFSTVEIPIDREPAALLAPVPVEPDVISNERPFNGRIYLMVLDDLHTDPVRTTMVRRAGRQFIERNFGANDLMAVVHTGGRAQASQEFTSDKRLLIAAVESFVGKKLQRGDRAGNAQVALRVLRDASEWLANLRGRRKTVLFISEGLDYELTDLIRDPASSAGNASLVQEDLRDAVLATARANVSVYAIDPRGLTSDAGGGVAPGDALDVPPIRGTPASAADGTVRAGMTDLWVSQQNLRTLSEQTGGFAVVNANQFDRAFERIVADNSSYYVLAYYPPSTRRDGRFHRIEVRVKRPGVTVRARRGYAAPRGDAPRSATAARSNVAPALAEAFSSPLPASGIRMKVFAAPFKAADRQASVLVGIELDGRDLTLDGTGKLEVSYLALDAEGRMRDGRTDTLALNLRPDTRARVQESGLRTLGRLSLPPGRYQLRTGALDSSGVVGTTVSYLEIPDYGSQPLSMSGIVLTSLAGTPVLTTRADEALKGLLPAPPIAARTFAQGDEIALFAEAYDAQAGTSHKVDVSVRVTAPDGAVLFRHEEERDSSELAGKTGGYGVAVRIPVADLPIGEHVLTVEARSRLAGNASATRHLTISVVPESR